MGGSTPEGGSELHPNSSSKRSVGSASKIYPSFVLSNELCRMKASYVFFQMLLHNPGVLPSEELCFSPFFVNQGPCSKEMVATTRRDGLTGSLGVAGKGSRQMGDHGHASCEQHLPRAVTRNLRKSWGTKEPNQTDTFLSIPQSPEVTDKLKESGVLKLPCSYFSASS